MTTPQQQEEEEKQQEENDMEGGSQQPPKPTTVDVATSTEHTVPITVDDDEAVIDAVATPATDGDIDDNDNKKQKKKKQHMKVAADAPWSERMWEVFTTFWPLGFVAFGGPQAHVAILRDHLVEQRDWLDEEQFMELFAIGQGLPGPTSTQLVVACALARAGPLGGILAFFLWNLPGAIVLTTCGVLIETFVDPNNPPWYLIGLPPAAISLVYKAFYSFAASLDKLGIILALLSCLVAILINNDARIDPTSSQYMFPSVLAFGGLVTWLDSKRKIPFTKYSSPSKGWDAENDEIMKRIGIPLWVGACIFLFWGVLFAAVVILENNLTNVYLEIFETMYRIGSIIFGGGQVVLPMLQDEVVPDWMTNDQYLQGLGLAQSMPGPLFNFSAYLGAVYHGVPGAIVAFLGLFGPGIILIFAMVPFWARLRHNATFKAILTGINAAAIGLVGAACVILWESAISTAADAMVFSIALTLDVVFHVQAPLCILAGGVVGAILHPDAADLGQVPYCEAQGYVEPATEATSEPSTTRLLLKAFYFV